MFYMHLYAILYDFWDWPINLEPSASFCCFLVLSIAEKENQTESNWPESSRNLFLDQKKPTEYRSWTRRVPGCPRGWGAHPHPGGDTSPSYLLFQTLLPFSWTLTCMIWIELTRTDAVFSRITMVLFYVQKTNILGMTLNSTEHLRKNNKKSSPKMKTRGPTPFSRGWGVPPLGHAPYLVGPWKPSDANSNSIYLLSERKKSERRNHRILRYGAAAKP